VPEATRIGSAGITGAFGFTVFAAASYSERNANCVEDRKTIECTIWQCTAGDSVPVQFDAGELTVSGVSVPQVSPGNYQADLNVAFPFEQRVLVQATGSQDVPRHELSVVAPSEVTFSGIDHYVSGPVLVDRDVDLIMRVSAGTRGVVRARLIASNESSRTILDCAMPVSQGGVFFPRAVLSELPLPPAGASVFLQVVVQAWSTERVGVWELNALAEYQIFSGTADLT
jgi:hypothetical protein